MGKVHTCVHNARTSRSTEQPDLPRPTRTMNDPTAKSGPALSTVVFLAIFLALAGSLCLVLVSLPR